MRVPRATYRLQFNRDSTFSDAAAMIPYLAELGVSDLYASPLARARPGSTHGYDVVDPNALNPELGTPEDFDRLVRVLHAHEMGLLLDIVPNHMGIGSDNGWWLDLLENGPASPYASFFDVDWSAGGRSELSGKVLLPVLGDHYRTVLEGGELELAFDADRGSLSAGYYEHRFPLDPKTYPLVLGGAASGDAPELDALVQVLREVPERDEVGRRDTTALKERLARLCARSSDVARAVEEGVQRTNDDSDALHTLLEAQAYRLAYWRVAGDEINYRRFFAVNDLAGIRVEDGRVFEASHRLTLDLVGQRSVTGLRIDHPDGLYDPTGYLKRLQKAAGAALTGETEATTSLREPLYVLVEKIPARHERLREDWPVSGTTGYEFINLAGGLFVDPAGEAEIDAAYHRFIGGEMDYEGVLYERKMLVMRTALASELDALSRLLLRISDYGRSYDFTASVLRETLSEVVARFSVYRTYVTPGSVSETDRRYVEEAVSRAREATSATDKGAYDFVSDALLLELDGPEEYRNMVLRFAMKFQQYTGPVMAKGTEDAAFYVYNRLVSLNEVGGEPDLFGVSVPEFHHSNAGRAKHHPHTMLSSSTHDTKRSEDVRARVSALSEIPGEWHDRLVRWASLNDPHRSDVGGEPTPSRNDQYLLYQTLLGAWPPGEKGLEEFRVRIRAYMEKAIREAQVHTSWTDPDDGYEAAVARFVDALLTPDAPFLREFLPFQRRVARLGALNSLSQTLIKLTAPGVPDIYQGNELWDFSLVDPDNRRPVDFGLRKNLLADLGRLDPSGARSLLEDGAWQEGRLKLYLTWKALALRRASPDLFARGEYVPLETSGEHADRLVAFARHHEGEAAIMAAPRLFARLVEADGPLLLPAPDAWSDTAVRLPAELAESTYRNALTGEKVATGEASLPVRELLRSFPVALLRSDG
ncbi:MAG TPA: malto-oligosyltrehalose synthase [Rubrobacteraceae bacterium]|nr:malto-oligosyltrehalose synthase [Rubrobacteraceae bacterium]